MHVCCLFSPKYLIIREILQLEICFFTCFTLFLSCCVDQIIEGLRQDGLLDVIWISDEEDNAPIYISSDEELEEDDFDPLLLLLEDEIGEIWSDGSIADSGYSTLTEDEDDPEDNDDNDIRPHYPLIEHLPPENFWQEWRRMSPPVPAAAPQQPIARPQEPVQPQKLPEQQVEQSEGGLLSVSLELEESAPSTRGARKRVTQSR